MRSLERLLAARIIKEKEIKNIDSVVVEQVEGEPWLIIKLKEAKKNGKPKEIRKKLTYFIWPDGNLSSIYEGYVAADMIQEGYCVVTLDGGWVVISPEGENYQLTEDTCSCSSFLYELEESDNCKHLVFRNWHRNSRAREAKYRSLFQAGALNLFSSLSELDSSLEKKEP